MSGNLIRPSLDRPISFENNYAGYGQYQYARISLQSGRNSGGLESSPGVGPIVDPESSAALGQDSGLLEALG